MRRILDSLCLHVVRHVFLITTQKLPDTGQLETQVAARLMGLGWATAIGGPRLELPPRLSRIHTSNEGRKEGRVVVVYPKRIATEDLSGQVRTPHCHLRLVFHLFVRFVLRNEMLKLEPPK